VNMNATPDPREHIVIAGAGAAGLSMAVELDSRLDSNWKITVIDPGVDDLPSKTWCFWGEPTPDLEPFVSHTWRKARVAFPGWERSDELDANPYHLVEAAPYHRAHLRALRASPRVRILAERVQTIHPAPQGASSQSASVSTTSERLDARWVFQSCFPQREGGHSSLLQHFGGWEIETQRDCFDPEAFTLMDFDVSQTGSATFRYLLPLGPRRALVEHTVFSSSLRLARGEYDAEITRWLDQKDTGGYRVVRREYGAIPMCDANFRQRTGGNVFNLGAAGGMTKPTTGYTFARLQRQVKHMADALVRTGSPAVLPDSPPRFSFYDGLLLEILSDSPKLGRSIFEKLFRRNPVDSVLTFLDEKSGLLDEAMIFASLPWAPFLGTLARRGRPSLALASEG
jgi:lycopene beta-cyclase